MTRIFVILSSLLLIFNVATAQNSVGEKLDNLLKAHQFVEMDKLNNQEKGKDFFYYQAVFENVCNRPLASVNSLNKLDKTASEFRNSFKYWKLKNDNYVKLHQYKNAYKSSVTLTNLFKDNFTTDELKDELNTQKIWQVLSKQKPQIIQKPDTVTINTIKDKGKLTTLKVRANNIESDFVFDTGAGISCITETNALKMGLTVFPPNDIEIQGFTGEMTNVRVGLAPKLEIGKIVIKNAYFLVYPDSAFSFGGGAYTINGIVGFPIAKELGTLVIEKNQITVLNEAENLTDKNLFIDLLRPVLMLSFNGVTLPFNFDSGASGTEFTKSFYDKFKTDLVDLKTKEVNSAGAGGKTITKTIFVAENFKMKLSNQEISFDKIKIDADDYGVYGKDNFGNIGQNLLKQYNRVIISFKNNYLRLEN
jgi:hypothetical protein